MNKSQLARHIGVKPQSVIQWEAGRTGIAKRNLLPVAQALNVSPEWLQFGRDLPDLAPDSLVPELGSFKRLPLVSWVQAGNWGAVVDNFQPGDAEDWVDTTRKVGQTAFALRIVGDSMEPKVPEGSIIIVDPDKEPINKSLVVVRLDEEEEATFKQLVIDGGNRFLKPINPRYPVLPLDGRRATICGVVRQVLIDLD